jgi:hypothetical protein
MALNKGSGVENEAQEVAKSGVMACDQIDSSSLAKTRRDRGSETVFADLAL